MTVLQFRIQRSNLSQSLGIGATVQSKIYSSRTHARLFTLLRAYTRATQSTALEQTPNVMGLGAFLKGAVKGVKGAVKKILPKKDSNSEGGSAAPSSSAPLMNSAFVFIKPHANTRAVQDLVVAKLTSKRVKILSEGDIAASKIDKDKLIDQHYYAIASKATLLKPDQLPVPEDKFEAKFGIAWKQALADKLVYNAIDACAHLGVDADGLDAKWQAAKQAGNMEKFGGGFYGAKLEGGIFVFNGFFMTMRSAFVAPGASIHYYVVEWDPKDLKWSEFRGDLLGPTDPAQAPLASLRGEIFAEWKALGLPNEPFTGENGVHASASPLEGLAERANWLKASVSKDSFGKAALAKGVPRKTLDSWFVDPQVSHPGGKGSVFDLFEDMDADECLAAMLTVTR